MNILKKINKMRLDRGWSIYRLSVESGVSQSTLTNMFNRETLPSITTLEYICTAFGISLSEFFAEDENYSFLDDNELLLFYHQLNNKSKECVSQLIKELSKTKQ